MRESKEPTPKIGKCFRMEYSLGVGYLQRDSKKYDKANDTMHGDIKVFRYPWEVKRRQWFGPTSAKNFTRVVVKQKTVKKEGGEMRNIAYIAGLCFALVCSFLRQRQAVLRHGRTRVRTPECQLAAGTTGTERISVYVFDRKNGKAVGKCRVCSDLNTIDIAPPRGKIRPAARQQHGRGAGGNQPSRISTTCRHSKPAWRLTKNRYTPAFSRKRKGQPEAPT